MDSTASNCGSTCLEMKTPGGLHVAKSISPAEQFRKSKELELLQVLSSQL